MLWLIIFVSLARTVSAKRAKPRVNATTFDALESGPPQALCQTHGQKPPPGQKPACISLVDALHCGPQSNETMAPHRCWLMAYNELQSHAAYRSTWLFGVDEHSEKLRHLPSAAWLLSAPPTCFNLVERRSPTAGLPVPPSGSVLERDQFVLAQGYRIVLSRSRRR